MWQLKSVLIPLQQGMHFFGERISTLVNTLLLSGVYLFGIGLPSILARLTGKQFLEMKLDRESPSYWRSIEEKEKSLKHYLRQF